MLAADFTDNPERLVRVFDPQENLLAPPVTYPNLCAEKQKNGFQVLATCSDLGSIPYNVTWRVELDRRLSSSLDLHLSFLNSRSFNVFVIDPTAVAGTGPALLLSNRGRSRYHEYEASLHYHPSPHADLTITYLHSRIRGDLNTISEVFIPFEQPVIRPNLYSNLPSDVPDRLTALGDFKLPWDVTLGPALDLHSGFAYSNVDVLDNYVGVPYGQRFPTFFSLDWLAYRDFPFPLRVHKGHKFRLGIYSIDTTRRLNPHDVYNNVTSSLFGTFTGLGKRINGIIISFAE